MTATKREGEYLSKKMSTLVPVKPSGRGMTVQVILDTFPDFDCSATRDPSCESSAPGVLPSVSIPLRHGDDLKIRRALERKLAAILDLIQRGERGTAKTL